MSLFSEKKQAEHTAKIKALCEKNPRLRSLLDKIQAGGPHTAAWAVVRIAINVAHNPKVPKNLQSDLLKSAMELFERSCRIDTLETMVRLEADKMIMTVFHDGLCQEHSTHCMHLHNLMEAAQAEIKKPDAEAKQIDLPDLTKVRPSRDDSKAP